MQFARKGTSDLICCCPNGRYAAVEVKHGKRQREPEQLEFGRGIARRNGISLVVRTVEALTDWLNTHKGEWDGSTTWSNAAGGDRPDGAAAAATD